MRKWFCQKNILPVLISMLIFLCTMLAFWTGVLVFVTYWSTDLSKDFKGSQNIVSAQNQLDDISCSPAEDSSSSRAADQTGSFSSLQESVASEVLRLHIIGDSNNSQDQEIKLLVKEAVVAYLEPILKDVTHKTDAIYLIEQELPALTALSDQVLAEGGFSYCASASLEKTYFPIKTYGDLTLPAGIYDSLQIRLGSAAGKNWWCLVFPRLCFVDVTYGTLPEESKAELAALLTREEYHLLFPDEENSTVSLPEKKEKPVLRFKIFDLLKELFS